MRTQKLFFLIPGLFLMLIFLTAESHAEELKELQTLRNAYELELNETESTGDKLSVLQDYISKLTSLEANLRANMRSRASINSVRKEIRKANRKLRSGGEEEPSKAVVLESPSTIPSAPVAEPEVMKVEIPEIKENIPPPPETVPELEPDEVFAEQPKPVVAPLSIPNIVPVIAAVTPVPKTAEIKPGRTEKIKASKPAPIKTSVVEKPKPVTPVSAPKPVVNPAVVKPLQKPVAVSKAKPAATIPAPKMAEPRFKSAAPKPVPVPIGKEKSKPAAERAEAKTVLKEPVKPAVIKQAATPKSKEPATRPSFKPAAPRVVSPTEVSKPVVTPAPVKKVEPVIPAPPPVQRAVTRAQGETYAVENRGVAGKRSIRKDNIYTFNIVKPGKKSTLTFYAAGQHSSDTFGKIWLINPNEQPVEIGRWKDSDFGIASDKVRSYRELKPITLDISKYVKKPGKYKVDFDWTDFGQEALVIFRVEIHS